MRESLATSTPGLPVLTWAWLRKKATRSFKLTSTKLPTARSEMTQRPPAQLNRSMMVRVSLLTSCGFCCHTTRWDCTRTAGSWRTPTTLPIAWATWSFICQMIRSARSCIGGFWPVATALPSAWATWSFICHNTRSAVSRLAPWFWTATTFPIASLICFLRCQTSRSVVSFISGLLPVATTFPIACSSSAFICQISRSLSNFIWRSLETSFTACAISTRRSRLNATASWDWILAWG